MMIFNVKGLMLTFCFTCLLYSCTLFEKEFILPLPVAENADKVSAIGFTAHWKKVTGATGYEIDIALDKDFTQIVSNYNSKKIETVFVAIDDLEANTTYYYRVRALLSQQTSKNSNVITVETPELTNPIVYPATEVQATSFRIHWKKMPIVTAYLLDIATDNEFKNILPDFYRKEVASDTTLAINDVSVNETYYYRIRVKQSSSFSEYSNIQSVLTSALPQPVVLPASNLQLTSFVANWKPMSEAVSYRIDVAKDALFQHMLTDYDNRTVTTNSLVIANLDAHTKYYYRVRGVNDESTSNHSEVMPAETVNLDTPVATTATEVGSGGFKANWNAVNNAASYLLDVALDANFTQILPGYSSLAVISNEAVIESLDASTTYYYRVRAQGLNATSDYSNVIQLTTELLPAPVATAATNQKVFEFTANWQAQTDIHIYLLDIATDAGFTNFVTGYEAREVAGTSHKIENLDFKATYYYRLRSKRLNKESDYSNTIQVSSCISNTCGVSHLEFFTGGSATSTDKEQTFIYDSQHRLSQIVFPQVHGGTRTTDISYHADGTIEKVTYNSYSSVKYTYLFTYSGEVLTSIRRYDEAGVYEELWTFTYNAQNQRTSWSVYTGAAKTTLDEKFDYTYDAKGNVTEVKNNTGVVIKKYEYDNQLSPYAIFHPDLCFFIATNRDEWTNVSSWFYDYGDFRGFLPINNIKKEELSGWTTEVFIFSYNSKDIAISQDAFYSARYTMTGCGF